MLDLNNIRFFMTTNDKEHCVTVQEATTLVSAVSETRLFGTKEKSKDDDRLRSKNRANALRLLQRNMVSWKARHS